MRCKTMSGPAFVGPDFEPVDFDAWNRCGSTVVVGSVLMCDHLAADAASTKGSAPGTNTFPYGQLINPATTGIGVNTDDPGAIFAVVTDLKLGGGADDTLVRVRAFGYCTVLFAGSTSFGDDMYPTNAARTLTTVQADAVRCLAKALCADSTTTGSGLAFFNGLLAVGSQTGNIT